MSDKHITINVLPQDFDCWVVIVGGIVACTFLWVVSSVAKSEHDAKARIEQRAIP